MTGTFGLVAASVVARELRGESVIDRSNGCDPWARHCFDCALKSSRAAAKVRSVRPHDTTEAGYQAQLEAWRRMGPERRVRVAFEMSEDVRRMAAEGIRALVLMLGASASVGCSIDGDCRPSSPYRVAVDVRDARTGAPISDASVVITDGAYRETLRRVTGFYEATQRVGTYTLTVTAPGYQPAAARTVVVTVDECQFRGAYVTIDLSP